MKDKLEKIMHGLIAGVIALMTAMFSIALCGAGLDLINKPSNLELLLGTVITMLSVAFGAFGVVMTMYYIKTRKD